MRRQDCGWPRLYLKAAAPLNATNKTLITLNATARLVDDDIGNFSSSGAPGGGSTGTAIDITVPAALVPAGFEIIASSCVWCGCTVVQNVEFCDTSDCRYGRASWPMTIFFSQAGGVPVLPWFAKLDQTLPWVIPAL